MGDSCGEKCDVGIAGVVEVEDVGIEGVAEVEDVGTAAPGCPAERSSAGLCGADTPVRAPAAPLPPTFTPAAGGAGGATGRGPGSNEARPRPRARRFSSFSFSLSPPCPFSVPCPAILPAAAVVINFSLWFHLPCHPEGQFLGPKDLCNPSRIHRRHQ